MNVSEVLHAVEESNTGKWLRGMAGVKRTEQDCWHFKQNGQGRLHLRLEAEEGISQEGAG